MAARAAQDRQTDLFPWLWMQMAPAFGLYKAGTRANSCMNLFEWTHERPKTTKRPTFSKPHSGVV